VQEGQKVSLTAAENKDTVELAVGVENEDITLREHPAMSLLP